MKKMLCQRCKRKEATVHITRFVGGRKEELHLCRDCAEELLGTGDFLSFDFSLPDLLGSLVKPAKSLLGETRQPVLRCPKCGLTYESFQEIGRLGCASCYKTFRNKLVPLLRRIHGNTKHGGKVPSKVGRELKVERELEKLKFELENAVRKEEYEKAAQIRDRIRELEGKIAR